MTYKIIGIDDSSPMLELLGRGFKRYEPGVVFIPISEWGLMFSTLFKNPDTDLLLVDYNMPGLTGTGIVACLKL